MTEPHLATETHGPPPSLFERRKVVAVLVAAGLLLGVALMWLTDFQPAGLQYTVVPR